MTLGLLVASENANRHTHRQDSCFISIDMSPSRHQGPQHSPQWLCDAQWYGGCRRFRRVQVSVHGCWPVHPLTPWCPGLLDVYVWSGRVHLLPVGGLGQSNLWMVDSALRFDLELETAIFKLSNISQKQKKWRWKKPSSLFPLHVFLCVCAKHLQVQMSCGKKKCDPCTQRQYDCRRPMSLDRRAQ